LEKPAATELLEEALSAGFFEFQNKLAYDSAKATPISCRKKIRKTMAFSPIRTRKEIQENHEFPGNPPALQ